MKSIILTDLNNNFCRIFISHITCIKLQNDNKVLITLVCGTIITVQESLSNVEELLK